MVASLIILLQISLSSALTPNLEALYNYSSITSYLSEMSNRYPGKVVYSNSSEIQSFTITTPSNYKKAKVLFVASLHSGFPLSTSLTMTLINYFLTNTSAEVEFILNSTNLIFIPVANPRAYVFLEKLVEAGEEPIPIWSGLEGQDWNCSLEVSGIDPDLNFDAGFEVLGERCSEEPYSGASPLESNISKHISSFYTSDPPVLTFILDVDGSSILYPTSNLDSSLSGSMEHFYASMSSFYTSRYGQFKKLETTKPGTLLDYAYSKGQLSYIINTDMPNPDGSANSNRTSDNRTQFIHAALSTLVSGVKLNYLNFTHRETTSNSSETNHTVHLFFSVNSSRYINSSVSLEILVDFDDEEDYEFLNATKIEYFNYRGIQQYQVLQSEKIVEEDDEDDGRDRKGGKDEGDDEESNEIGRRVNFTLNGFSGNIIQLVYWKKDKWENIEFEVEAKLVPVEGSGYFTSESAQADEEESEEDSEEDDGRGRDRRETGAMLGALLLIVLLVLLGIAGTILFFNRVKRPENTGDFSQNQNVG